MGDVRILWDVQAFRGDVAMAGPDLENGNDLETAVLISLFTHGRAPASYVPTDGTTDRRGWWADTYEIDNIGSLLWTFYRSKRTQTTLNDLRDCVSSALDWMIEDGVAATIDVTAQWYNKSAAAIGIVIHKPQGPPSRFSYVWSMETGSAA